MCCHGCPLAAGKTRPADPKGYPPCFCAGKFALVPRTGAGCVESPPASTIGFDRSMPGGLDGAGTPRRCDGLERARPTDRWCLLAFSRSPFPWLHACTVSLRHCNCSVNIVASRRQHSFFFFRPSGELLFLAPEQIRKRTTIAHLFSLFILSVGALSAAPARRSRM